MTKIRITLALLLAALVAALTVSIPTQLAPAPQPQMTGVAFSTHCYPERKQHTVKEHLYQVDFTYHINRARLDWYKCYSSDGSSYEKTLGLKWGYRNIGDSGACQSSRFDGYRVNPRSFNGVNVGSKWIPCDGYDQYRYIYLFASTYNTDCVTLDVEAVWEGVLANENFTMRVCSHKA